MVLPFIAVSADSGSPTPVIGTVVACAGAKRLSLAFIRAGVSPFHCDLAEVLV